MVELIRGLHNVRPRHAGCAVTIGNFDGVHLGHKAIFKQLTTAASELGLPTTLVTFEPQPQEFFAGGSAAPRLTRFKEKISALRETRLDRVLLLRFNRALADTSAEEFIERVLVNALGTKYLVVGDDFRFGRDGLGNLVMLREVGAKRGFQVVDRDTVKVGGGRVSSSWVRDALANGELGVASELLGRAYSICGRVAYGDQLGRTIGFPTANVEFRRHASPMSGVYAVTVEGLGPAMLRGMANIGVRPTVGGKRLRLEIHLFDFEDDIYGRDIRTNFLYKLRDERRFDSLDALKAQIARDSDAARAFFSREDK